MDERKQGADHHVAKHHVEEQLLVGPAGPVAFAVEICGRCALQQGVEVVAGAAVPGQDLVLRQVHDVPFVVSGLQPAGAMKWSAFLGA